MTALRRFVDLHPGDPAPWFTQRSHSTPNYVFDTAAGRWILLCFHASASDPVGREALAAILARRDLFDDEFATCFAVTVDRGDLDRGLRDVLPGLRCLHDFDGAVSRRYGVLPEDARPGEGRVPVRRLWFVLDPTLRIVARIPFGENGAGAEEAIGLIERLPPPGRHAGFEVPAPILVLPDVFEPELCETLIALHQRDGGTPSGFMRERDGRTVLVHDAGHKVRRDAHVTDPALLAKVQARVRRRIVPEVRKIHQFAVTRMERYLVACYSAEDGGHFRPHRDNTTRGTAHRRFAVSVNLNAEFEGGEIGFPEYGPRTFKPAPGAAIVFSCSLLHTVTPVTRGRRYAFLPFLYDDAAASQRLANNAWLDAALDPYRPEGDAAAGTPADPELSRGTG
ncbi:MAG: 2OG-Fe(II) oxygenase [Burkholderiales bacterium]|jgi:predicted 2-oxoglutarate/Fe(II)-dependent dioxygenase YbiX/peroxiredoxin